VVLKAGQGRFLEQQRAFGSLRSGCQGDEGSAQKGLEEGAPEHGGPPYLCRIPDLYSIAGGSRIELVIRGGGCSPKRLDVITPR